MHERSPRADRRTASAGSGGDDTPPQAGVIGIGLAAVLTFSLAEGSWEWFATYIGATLIAVVLAFYRLPPWTTGLRSSYARNLAAYSVVVGLCLAIAMAPALQRSSWLLPMPGVRDECRYLGRYAELRAEVAPTDLTGRDRAAVSHAQDAQGREAVADCLAHTTTRWLPLYGLGAAGLVGLGAWSSGRARARREAGTVTRNPRRQG